ncbi:hypothetical protein AABM04_01150 [Listeria ivanovii]|uniref:hypothetical protein n=1 Tax=Listeria ivanovii TaxID=1638 RepID=UPI003CF14387
MSLAKITNTFINVKNLSIFSIASLYGILALQGSFNQYNMNFAERSVSLLSDPYLFIYFILPIWIMLVSKEILTRKDYQNTIRLKTKQRYNLWLLRKCMLISFSLITVLLISSICISVGGDVKLTWSSHIANYQETGLIVSVLNDLISSPISAILVQLLVYFIFLSTIAYFIITITYKIHTPIFIYCVSLLILIYMMYTFTFAMEPLYMNISSLAFAYRVLGQLSQEIIVYTVILVTCILLNTNKVLRKINDLYMYQKKHIIFLAVILVSYVFLGINGADLSINDYIISTNYGSSNEGYTINSILFYAIIYLGIPYLILLGINEKQQLIYYELIRQKTMNKWIFKNILAALQYSCLYLMVTFLIMIGSSYKNYQELLSIDGEILYQYFINGSLQIFFYSLIILLTYSITGKITYALYLNLGLIILLLPVININHILPIGLNAMGMLEDRTPYQLSLQLLIAILMITMILILVNRKRTIPQ